MDYLFDEKPKVSSPILNEALYLHIKNVIDKKTIDQCLTFLNIQREQEKSNLCQFFNVEVQELKTLADKYQNRHLVSTLPPEIVHALSGQYSLEVRLSKQIKTVLLDANLLSVLKDITCFDEIFCHMPPMVRFIEPCYPYSAVPPHRDISYNSHIDEFYTVWIPFVEINDENQGIVFYDKNFDDSCSTNLSTTGFWLSGENTETSNAIHNDMQPGDLVIFPSHTLHGSGKNLSSNTRYSMDFRIFKSNRCTSKHCMDMNDGTVYPPKAGKN